MQRYYAVIDKDPESDFGVSFPDFPGCFSAGGTVAEALANGEEALALHIKGTLEVGEPLPPPRSLEDILGDPEWRSGAVVPFGGPRAKGRAVRVSVTFDEHLLADIDRDAKAAGLSRSAYLALTAKEHLLRPST